MATSAASNLPPRMSVEEFLGWDDVTDTRYELVDGRPVAMRPPLLTHAALVGGFTRELGNRLRPPCMVYNQAGIRLPHRDDAFYVADLAVQCAERSQGARYLEAPVVIVEVLSPSTAVHDRGRKSWDYREHPAVQEIAFLHTTAIRADLYRREGPNWLLLSMIGPDSLLELLALGAVIPLRDIYRGIALEESDAD